MATGEIKQRRAVWDFDPAIAIERQLQDVVSAVWNAVTYGVLAEDGDITATASELLPGVVEFAFQHAKAGGRWGRLVVRRESEGVTLLCFVGPEFLQGNTPDEVARADLPAMRQWLRKRHDWRVGLWSYVVSEVMDRLQDEFKAVKAKGGDRKRAADRGVSGHLPLSKELRKLWRRAYLVMCEFKRERLDDHDDIPTWQEYSERVLERLKWKREEQVLRWIMQEGKAGKLTEPK